jgi:hypothetical protein
MFQLLWNTCHSTNICFRVTYMKSIHAYPFHHM